MKRRDFLQAGACIALGGAGIHSALGNLRLMEATTRAYGPKAFNDYKALVCVFLFGGNDALNSVIPYDTTAYQRYAQARATLAVPRANLLPLTALAGGGASDGAQYALQASTRDGDAIGTGGMRQLFDSGRMAILGNVGTLVRPVTKADYVAGRAELPPQLYSHNDQSSYWQTSAANVDTGWGGRIADLLHDANPDAFIPIGTSLNTGSQLLSGRGSHYVVGNDGPRLFSYLEWDAGVRRAYLALNADNPQAHPFERHFAASFRRARENAWAVTDALESSSPLQTAFPAQHLGRQLAMVARMIKVRQVLGLKRQIFYVSLGGFDHHDGLLDDHPVLLAQVSHALKAFHDATVELGVADSVTTFTASDFGRTLSSNGDGSDHGWGAHHFVVGGAVRGGRFYGTMPVLQNDGPDAAEGGRMIPTTAVDQYAATLARWFGVADGDLDLVFPNLRNFAGRNLGFMG
ncbi:MAG TPA: DUF1501 domain-containing protein [Luteimonas sp.]|nr:DUF1501 domain-containing protein [Luteimonas sp.]HRO28046.1 DUF1501 domain-containing protein [Luteimonas sp.]HRP72520.1 DUF1501 domain-containing protein [Luteimonas sp.]